MKAILMLSVVVAALLVTSAAEARWFGVGGWRGGIGWGRGVGWRGVGFYGVRRAWYRPALAVGAGLAAASYYRRSAYSYGYPAGYYSGYSAPACTCPSAGYGYGYGW
jgi:hypothetical protein